ncbi:MAG TPA: acyltransferase [Acidimicrobiales bacterium]|nr:acyltransferase [Acidimicrobiales bacterium]
MSPDPSVFVHPQGLCESDEVGARTRVWAWAHVLPGAVVGEDCNICDHAFVEGGVRLGDRVTVKNGVLLFDGVTAEDDVFLGPAVVFTNDFTPRAHIRKARDEFLPTRVERGASIGANATIVCGTTIGANALVAAGSVVTRDVAPHGLVMGNPARRVGWVCVCGTPLDPGLACKSCHRTYVPAPEGEGLVPA